MKGRKARKQNKNNKSVIGPVPATIQVGIPPVAKRVLHAAVQFSPTTNTTTDTVFYLTSAYNPWGATDIHQGYWFDQMATIYKKCFVESAKWAVRNVVLPSNSQYDEIVCFPSTLDTAVVTQPSFTVTRPLAQYVNVRAAEGQGSWNNNEPSKPLISGAVKSKDFFAYKDWQDFDALHSLTTSDTTTDDVYLHFVCKSTNGNAGTYMVEMWQTVAFFEPLQQSQS